MNCLNQDGRKDKNIGYNDQVSWGKLGGFGRVEGLVGFEGFKNLKFSQGGSDCQVVGWVGLVRSEIRVWDGSDS